MTVLPSKVDYSRRKSAVKFLCVKTISSTSSSVLSNDRSSQSSDTYISAKTSGHTIDREFEFYEFFFILKI